MPGLRTASFIIAAGILAGSAQAGPEDSALQSGSYEVTFRLEIPHVENWAVDKTTTICVPNAAEAYDAALPVLSGNNPLAKCPARNIQRDGATLRFDISCPGRNAARARAVYTLTPRTFKGRIAMVMGGKNMTMTEVQVGHRIGSCDLAGAP
jgi:Protein of unknown function (DUF3617)